MPLDPWSTEFQANTGALRGFFFRDRIEIRPGALEGVPWRRSSSGAGGSGGWKFPHGQKFLSIKNTSGYLFSTAPGPFLSLLTFVVLEATSGTNGSLEGCKSCASESTRDRLGYRPVFQRRTSDGNAPELPRPCSTFGVS